MSKYDLVVYPKVKFDKSFRSKASSRQWCKLKIEHIVAHRVKLKTDQLLHRKLPKLLRLLKLSKNSKLDEYCGSIFAHSKAMFICELHFICTITN